MRQNPSHDSFDDRDEPPREVPAQVRRVSTTPGAQGAGRRGEVRYLRASQRPAVRRGPDPRIWFIRGSIGVAALAGLWLGLQAMFPVNESRVTEAPAPTLAVDATTSSAPEPPAVAQAAPPEVAQPAQSDSSQPAAPAQPAAEAAAPPQPQAQPTVIPAPPAPPQPTQPPLTQPTPVPDRLPGLQPRPGEAADQPAPAPASPPQEAAASQDAAPTQQIAAAQPAQPPADPAATPTAAPIPPPENPQSAPPQAAPPPITAAPPAPAPARPAAAPAPAAASGGPFALAASASPANPISEQAQVTVTVKATQNGVPLAGAFCMATVYYRTATAKLPSGGFTTNGNGVGSFVLDARGSTYGYYIPIDVTCTGRAGTASTRTGFTPVKGR